MSILKLQCPICLEEQDVYPHISVYTCSKFKLPIKHCLIWKQEESYLELQFLNINLDKNLSIAIDQAINVFYYHLFNDGMEIGQFLIDEELYYTFKSLILENTNKSKENIKKLLLLR